MPEAAAGNVTYRATAGAKPRQGSSRFLLVADRKIDARSQAQDSPRRTSGHAAQIRGSEHDHRRLKASPHRCTIITSIASNTDCGGGRRAAASSLDTGHQSKNRLLTPSDRSLSMVRFTPESRRDGRPRQRGARRGHVQHSENSYSITWSARSKIDCGTVMSSALAVLRFRTISNLVGNCTGRSPGFAPRKMRST